MPTIVYDREVLRTIVLVTEFCQLQVKGGLPTFGRDLVVMGLEVESAGK